MKLSTLKGLAGATAMAVVLAAASQASATTVDFATGGDGTAAGGSVAGGPLTYTLSAAATGFLNGGGASVTQSSNGLGVNGSPDLQPYQIDSIPGSEVLTVTFSWAVKLLDISLGLLNGWDDFEIATNNTGYTHYGPNLVNPISIGENYVTWFSIRASGDGERWRLGNDAFTLATASVAAVPVPAAGFLLMGALGGLAALRRRKTLTAA